MAEKKKGGEIPAWMATFADMMALMMTFFVLLYSFSSVDETKYKLIVQSLAKGFGSTRTTMKTPSSAAIGPQSMTPSSFRQQTGAKDQRGANTKDTRKLKKDVENKLATDIAQGSVSVETTGNKVIIRFPEEIAFPPGTDEITDEIMPILQRVAEAISDSPGTIMVSGHTDDRPIKTARIGSNWELSTKRAVSIIHRLEGLGIVEPNRLSATGYGDTQPIAPNDTAENRAKNRRVEIAIIREEG